MATRRFTGASKAATPKAPARRGTGRPSGGTPDGGGRPNVTIADVKAPVSWKGFLVTAVVGGVLTCVYKFQEMKIKEEMFRSVGKAALGGPFELNDTEGKPTTDKDFLGDWMLLYFGFTHCPDICPDELNKISGAITALDNTWWIGPVVRPVLISCDPKRDTKEVMKKYIAQFHPRMVGLTGTEEQVKVAARAYRVYYNPTNDDDENYLVDHSIIAYLINPEGEFVAFYGQEDPETGNNNMEHVITKMKNQLWEYKKLNFWQKISGKPSE